MKKLFWRFLPLLLLITGLGCNPHISKTQAPTPAFPGAEGFGKYASGGRGGIVITVNSLADSGPGTLREAIRKKGPRTIVFAVSGTIRLLSDLDINQGDLTIAGQTAPGDGICLRDFPTHVKADNVIIRYLRFRLGDESRQEGDALNGTGHKRIIIDHCSMSWSVDECASFYYNTDFTLQWCIISQSLNQSVHTKGPHGYGGIWGGQGASFHHNLIVSNNSRNPRFSGSSTTPNTSEELVDFRNNVIFNWGSNSIYGGEKGRYNMVNNYFKAGPATGKKIRSRIVNPSSPYGLFFVSGNFIDGDETVTINNWQGGVQCDHPDSAKANRPFTVESIAEESATDAYLRVLDGAGASLIRDKLDQQMVSNVRNGVATEGKLKNGLIDSQSAAGSWPELKSLPALTDTDSDGLPDVWETAAGLNPHDGTDAMKMYKQSGYPAIEVYINELADKK
ncbi:MAG: pectate lyase [Chitinophagaceae bacterium]